MLIMLEEFYKKNYVKLLLIPIIVFLLSVGFIAYYYNANGDVIKKDVSLSGGTSVTIPLSEPVDIVKLESDVAAELEEVSIRLLADPTTRTQEGLVIDTRESDSEKVLEVLDKYLEFDRDQVSIESTGPSLGKSFYKDLILTLSLAFLFMALAVFISFRNFIPSIAVISAALMDIVITVAILDLLGISIAAGGIVALLLVIGYSIDTDVLLTTKMLKQSEGSPFERIKASAKTGLTMTVTTIVALVVAFVVSFNPLLKQMFMIITIALVIDIFTTYFTNAGILYWYVERKKK